MVDGVVIERVSKWGIIVLLGARSQIRVTAV